MHAIGCDIVQIPRIEALLERHGDAFLSRVFSECEQLAASKYDKHNRHYAAHFAKRFAAKEAFAKALGCGFGKVVAMIDVAVTNNNVGAPQFKLSEKAQQAVSDIFGENTSIQLSLSDDYPQALAFVTITSM